MADAMYSYYRRGDRNPIESCLEKHKSNSTIGFHDCMCEYDYSYSRSNVKALKMRHCRAAAEMYKMNNFYTYIIIAVAVGVFVIGGIAAFCSCKWYWETRRNPCGCCSSISSCTKLCRSRKKKKSENPVNVFEQPDSGHTWSPVNLPPERESEDKSPPNSPKRTGLCMNFCLSDPVQDCCEFFDCDIMWGRKQIYSLPYFSKKRQHFHRRPSRPAPPPPKAVVLPQVKHLEPVLDDIECEPVPEAPPSPEPIRPLPQKAMYVDPLAFLQRPFLRAINKEIEEDEKSEKDEPVYSKFKNMVLSKVKKSSSLASINKLGVSDDPNGVSLSPNGFSGSSKKLKTASLASLNNIDEHDGSYGSKRSLSLASLKMFEGIGGNSTIANDPRSRISVISSSTADDIPPAARKDEYIDLEEMSRRMEARMLAAKKAASQTEESREMPSPSENSSLPKIYTPNFIPASAFPKTLSSFDPNSSQNSQYYPPVPASQGKPAVPARTSVGSPIYSMSPTGTLGRAKPVIPPRPPNIEAGRNSPKPKGFSPSNSPRSNSVHRSSPRLMKPTGPPPPPPSSSNKGPIESAI